MTARFLKVQCGNSLRDGKGDVSLFHSYALALRSKGTKVPRPKLLPAPPHGPRGFLSHLLPEFAVIALGMSTQLFNSVSKSTASFKQNDIVAFFACQPWNHHLKKKRNESDNTCVSQIKFPTFLRCFIWSGKTRRDPFWRKAPGGSLWWCPELGCSAPTVLGP